VNPVEICGFNRYEIDFIVLIAPAQSNSQAVQVEGLTPCLCPVDPLGLHQNIYVTLDLNNKFHYLQIFSLRSL
jgi:hypothetical protein